MKTVVTRSGDTWDILAKRLYGDERFMSELIKANLHYRCRVIFSDGVVLKVPTIDTASSDFEANLPPWIQGRGKS